VSRPPLAPTRKVASAAAAALALTLALPLRAAPPAPEEWERAVAAAATASRVDGLAGARRALAPWLAPAADPASGARARTLLGLLAHAHDDPGAAAELLAGGPGPSELEDWRLYVLADSRAALGAVAPARSALVELLALHPETPLRPRALSRLIELALRAGDTTAALERIAQARAEHLPLELVVETEQLAWRLGLERGDTALLAEAGRRLLVVAPLEASRLRVVDTLNARRAGSSDWRLWLSPDELVARSAALLDADLPAGALTTLAAVAPERRGFGWRLLEARALTDSNRGAEALAALADLSPRDAAETSALAWHRALAALEASRSRRHRGVPAAEAERLHRAAREHLLAVVRAGGDAGLAARALSRLAAEYLAAGRTAEAIAAYRQLRSLRADDRSGARPLWENGWESYERGNRVGAILVWRELAALYPESSSARSARYWTARAVEEQGRKAEARQLYLEVLAADTADFYARQAALRLVGASDQIVRPAPEPETWPSDPRLARARFLTDAGLDELARTELELVGTGADGRARAAVAALVHARTGERRASLTELRRAFPEIGTPHQGSVPADALALFYPTDFRPEILAAAAAEAVPAHLVYGMVHQESAFDAGALSRSGARGLMQLMPTTGREVARRLGLPYSTSRLSDPGYSVRLGTHYFRQMLDRFGGNVELALAGYNGGPGRISRLWRAAGPNAELDRFLEGLSVTESRNYVKRILVIAESYRSLYPDLG